MIRQAAVVALALLASAAGANAASAVMPFGTRVIEVAKVKAPLVIGDFDGDGTDDTVYLVSVSGGMAPFAPDVEMIENLWTAMPLGAHAAQRALAIILGKSNRKFLITDYGGDTGGYFDTPIWQEPKPPVDLARKGSKPFIEFHAQEKHIAHDILVLGTEAGIDTALYWDGKSFKLFAPAEEP